MEGSSCDLISCSAVACESATGCTSTQNGCSNSCDPN
jgi:hypothetical protein